MFEPLGKFIRLRRVQRNLTQDGLAQLAHVSRRQLALVEEGENVSVLFLVKVARALELTELPIGELRLRAAPPELAPIVRAADLLERLKPALAAWASAEQQINDVSASLDDLIGNALASGASARDIIEVAERLSNIPAAERPAAGETLRALSAREPRARSSRSKPRAAGAAKRR